MQEELLVKFKADHGELPVWNAKKKLNVKAKGTPASKTKITTPKAKPITKPAPKPKIASKKAHSEAANNR